MSGLQILITASPTGPTLMDVSPWANSLRFGGNEHGFTFCSCRVPMQLKNQFWLYDRPGLPHVKVGWCGATVWEGRLEDVAPSADGLYLGALGYQRTLSDAKYSGLWSHTKYSRWRQETSADAVTRSPEKYEMDNNNRLAFGLRKNETYANATEAAGWTMAAPHNGAQNIYRVIFDYSILLPLNWNTALQSFAYDFTSFTSEWSLAATGALQTGSITQNLAANKDRITFRIINVTGLPYNWLGETGAAYARITNLRVLGSTNATIGADDIAREFIAYTNALNPGQLSADTGQVSAPGVDLRDEVYDDMDMRDILTHLALIGDSSQQQYEWAVWENRQLVFRPRGSRARTWYVDISEPEIRRTLDALRNSVYAVYQEPRGDTLRTAANADAFSQVRYGITRQAALPTTTTSLTQAQAQRDAYLADRKTPIPQVGIKLQKMFDAAGQSYPLWLLRANDTVVIRNLNPSLSVEIDRLRRFRASEYQYDAVTGVMTVVPESPLPTLDVLLARRANAA